MTEPTSDVNLEIRRGDSPAVATAKGHCRITRTQIVVLGGVVTSGNKVFVAYRYDRRSGRRIGSDPLSPPTWSLCCGEVDRINKLTEGGRDD